MLNIALFGYDVIGKLYFYNILDNKELNLKWVCDRSSKLSFQALDEKERYSLETIKIVQNPNLIINDKSIDCVIISKSPEINYDLTKSCLLSGKHILVENLFLLSLDKISELYDLAQNKNLILLGCCVKRFDSIIIKFKKDIDRLTFSNKGILNWFTYKTDNYYLLD
jgi:predicted dehydrogenase